MGVEPELSARIADWDRSSRWERSELGKDLRRLGLSYGEIMDLIPVKKSTLATWCREVRLSDEQYAAIKERTYGSRVGIPVDTNWKRRDTINGIRRDAMTQAIVLVYEPLWTAGTALYWGEGYKTQSTLGMANAEPAALRLFMNWTRCYHSEAAEFRARLNVHANNDEPRARQWWERKLGLGPEDFTRSFVKPDGTGHRKNHLAYGVCAVRMRRSADAFHRTIAWVEFLADRLGN
jgi:hypothetical protein